MNAITMRNNRMPLFIIAAIVIFLLGGLLGIVYQSRVKLGASAADAQLGSMMHSGAVSAVLLYGTVKSVSGQTVVISNNGGTAPVSFSSIAKVYSFDQSQKDTTPQPSSFASVKAGNMMQINAKVTSSSQLEAISGVIISSGAVAK